MMLILVEWIGLKYQILDSLGKPIGNPCKKRKKKLEKKKEINKKKKEKNNL